MLGPEILPPACLAGQPGPEPAATRPTTPISDVWHAEDMAAALPEKSGLQGWRKDAVSTHVPGLSSGRQDA